MALSQGDRILSPTLSQSDKTLTPTLSQREREETTPPRRSSRRRPGADRPSALTPSPSPANGRGEEGALTPALFPGEGVATAIRHTAGIQSGWAIGPRTDSVRVFFGKTAIGAEPERLAYESPGQRPGWGVVWSKVALKGRHKPLFANQLWRPFRASGV
jgi:hypothetical protein